MVSLSLTPQLSYTTTAHHPVLFNSSTTFRRLRHRELRIQQTTISSPCIAFSSLNQPLQQTPRTLFPGGYKRPEIKVPNLVLQLASEDVLNDDKTVLDVVDKAVSKQVGIVVLTGGGASGAGKLYEAARLLKSIIKDRAYFLIDERVDIAAAVNASGVLLSDQGLPAIVARNTMSGSQSDSVVLPLVARNVQTSNAALDASGSEGADFLIYKINKNSQPEELVSPVLKSVKIPIFVTFEFIGNEKLIDEASYLLKLGASGLVLSLEEFKLFNDDRLSKILDNVGTWNEKKGETIQNFGKLQMLDGTNGSVGKSGVAGFVNLDERERQFIETERLFLLEAIEVIRRAAPLMEEVSLLTDAVSQLDEPFLLAIVGEFNSGKSTVINALLGKRYVKDGVIPTTNEITFLRYSESDSNEQQRCERHPDGQYACYLPAPILKNMIIVDTPGTNVILQRQQRLTEEFVPRADLILFVISADRPLTESEVNFLRYIQQWKKKVVFVLNKSDLYQTADELQEAITFVKDNVKKMLNAEHVLVYPVSARSALEEKLSASAGCYGELDRQSKYSQWGTTRFSELEQYLYSFLDGSTSNGIERVKLKLETPVRIAEQLLSACQKIAGEECQQAKEDLVLVDGLISSVNEYGQKMERESIAWKKQILSLIDNTQARVVKIAESTLKLSNLDLVTKYIFKGDKSSPMPATASIQNDIIDPALSDGQKLLRDYVAWLQSNSAREGRFYKESLESRWPSFLASPNQAQLDTGEFLGRKHVMSIKVLQDFSAAAASKLFEQEIREVFLGAFGGLGAAGLSASLLTSVLPTTLEDLLALGFCSAGGLLAISNFPARRQRAIDKVKRTGDALARELDEAMQKDLLDTTASLENFVKHIGKPYQEAAQHRASKVSATLDELSDIEKKLRTLQIDIQNIHVL